MALRKKTPSVEYELLSIALSCYRASVDASVNPYARDKRHHDADPKIYSFGSSVELEGVCDYPDKRFGGRYVISVHGRETGEGQFGARLSSRHVRDEDGPWKYRKVRGKEIHSPLVHHMAGAHESTDVTGVIPNTKGHPKGWPVYVRVRGAELTFSRYA